MKNKRKLFLLSGILFLVVCLFFLHPSYSYYKLTKENSNALHLQGVELAYTITSTNLTDKKITVPASSKQTITLEVESDNAKNTEYEVYYQILGSLSQTERDRISVECYKNASEDLPTGEISPSGVKIIVVEIENNNTVPVTIELGCQGGLVGRDLVLEQGSKIPVVTTPVLQVRYSSEVFWQYKSSITKVIFQNQMQEVPNATYQHDISQADDGSIMAYLVLNSDRSTYTAYIQCNGIMQANPNSSRWFDGFTKLQSIEGLEYFDTSQVTSMEAMFSNCSSLTSLDLSSFDTSHVTNMWMMFQFCEKLANLNISSFETSQVTSMRTMFNSCSSLTNLDLSHFDTSQVTDMTQMFSYCRNLTNLNLSSFDTSQVTTMYSMFAGNSLLTNLDISSFSTSKVTDMEYMFSGCSSLTSLDFRNATFTNVTSYNNMFTSYPSSIQVTVKDSAARTFIQNRLNEANGGTVIIA